MYRFKWPLCKKKCSVLVWCYTARGDRVQDLQRYSCIKQWCDKPSGYGCLSKKCEQGEHEAVTLLYLVPWPSCLTYRVKTQDSKRYVSHHWPVSLVTAVRSLLPLLFLRSLGSLTVNIRSCLQEWNCHELDCVECHPHTEFIIPNFLHICVMIIAGLLIFRAVISVGVCIGKCLTSIQIGRLVRLFEF